jgi:hypothetical protein
MGGHPLKWEASEEVTFYSVTTTFVTTRHHENIMFAGVSSRSAIRVTLRGNDDKSRMVRNKSTFMRSRASCFFESEHGLFENFLFRRSCLLGH